MNDKDEWIPLQIDVTNHTRAMHPTIDSSKRKGFVFWDAEIRYTSFRFVVQFLQDDDDDNRNDDKLPTDVEFEVTDHNQDFTLVELSIVLCLCTLTFVFFSYWMILYCTSRNYLIPEQRWMVNFFGFIYFFVFLNNIFFFFNVFTNKAFFLVVCFFWTTTFIFGYCFDYVR